MRDRERGRKGDKEGMRERGRKGDREGMSECEMGKEGGREIQKE